MTSYTVLKCIVEGTPEKDPRGVFRLRLPGPLKWDALRVALADAFGSLSVAKYEDEEGDWCTLAKSTFEDFLVVNHRSIHESQNSLVKLHVNCSLLPDNASGTHGMASLPIPDGGAPPNPADACGPKPFLAALKQLSCGSVGGWTASNVCTLVLAFMPTLEQRALRKMEKMNKTGSVIVDSLRDVLEQLHIRLSREPGLEDVVMLLQDVQGGKRAHELGKFVVDLLRALRPLPFSKQQELLTPALSVLLQSRPNFFTEVFGEQTPALVSQSGLGADVFELPSGRCVPIASIMSANLLAKEHKVHLACLGGKSLPKNAWANLRISDKGVVGLGGVGAFATFRMRPAGQNASGFNRVSFESCGGGGLLSSQGEKGFAGGPAGPNAVFLLKSLGEQRSGERKATAFALLTEGEDNHAIGVGPCGGIKIISADTVDNADDSAAFLILDAELVQGCKTQMKGIVTPDSKAEEQVKKKLEREAAALLKKEQAAEAKAKEQAKKQAEKEAVKAVAAQAKAEEQVKKQAEKEAAKAAGAQAKAEEQAKKQAEKEAMKAAAVQAKAEEQAKKKAEKEAAKAAAAQAKAEDQAKKNAEKECRNRSKDDIVKVTNLSDIVDGAAVFLETASGRLRVKQDGSVDAKGGWGQWTHFIIHLQGIATVPPSDGVEAVLVALQSQAMPQRYLRLPVGAELKLQNLASDGQELGQADSVFEITTSSDAKESIHTFNLRLYAHEREGKNDCNIKLYMKRSSSEAPDVSEEQAQASEEIGTDLEWLPEISGKELAGFEIEDGDEDIEE